MAFGLSASKSESRTSATGTARTQAKTANKGGNVRVAVKGDAASALGGLPSWALLLLLVFLLLVVVVAAFR